MLESEECLDIETDGETVSLSPSSFWALFTLTAGTSTITLLFYTIHSNSDKKNNLETNVDDTSTMGVCKETNINES